MKWMAAAFLVASWGVSAEPVIPTGTKLTVRLVEGVDSKTHSVGQTFRATLDEPVVVDGKVVLEKGKDAITRLVESRSGGVFTGRAELILALVSVEHNGKTYEVSASEAVLAGKSQTKRTGWLVGAGAALGAMIGAIAGGGKGAAIGAAAGAGAGGAYQILTRGEAVRIPSETRLTFQLGQPLRLN
ncbi:MAG: hypothetical protein NZV14_06250 [Bryobacteraceae bacterium]|nr:hypothetical protein [Bryobacteraceae bacterium]MDW8377743.1 hypothetical protein [Bryobacterales bacterium]